MSLPTRPTPESGEALLESDIDVVEDSSRPSGKHARTAASQVARLVRDLPAVARYGRYELLGRIAFGGMAEIFLARERTAGSGTRNVVVKRILPHVADDEGFVQMFLDEARIAMRLSHPGIVHIYEFGQEGGTSFIAMEWVNGVSLGKLIKRARNQGGVPPAIAARVLANVADALHHAHEAVDDEGEPLGIVHRDVSPQNVMLAYDGHVKLLDFGVAKARSSVTRTEAGVVKGKLAYMAPEQCRGEAIDARADVFSLGVCLFETLTGKPLYHRPTDFETMRAVMDEAVPSIRTHDASLPASLDAIVQRALAKQPSERWQSAGELAEALEGFLGDQKERVGASRVAELLAKMFANEIAVGPQLQATTPSTSGAVDAISASMAGKLVNATSGQARAVTPRPSLDAVPPSAAAEPRRGTPFALVVALVVVAVAAGGGGVWWWLGRGHEPARPIAALPPTTRPLTTASPRAAPPVTAPPVAHGAALFESTPAGATVLVDGVEVPGTTPVTVGELPLGVHAVEMRRGSEPPWTGQMLVEDGAQAHVAATFAAAPMHHAAPVGSLAINTRPWSKVYLGSHLLGTTPIGNAEVPSGDITLRLVDRDGETHRVHVHVDPGQRATAFFDLSL